MLGRIERGGFGIKGRSPEDEQMARILQKYQSKSGVKTSFSPEKHEIVIRDAGAFREEDMTDLLGGLRINIREVYGGEVIEVIYEPEKNEVAGVFPGGDGIFPYSEI